MNLIRSLVLLKCMIATAIAQTNCVDGATFFETINKAGPPPPEKIWGTNDSASEDAQKAYKNHKFECGMCTSYILVQEVPPNPGPAVEGQLKCVACSSSFVADSATNYYTKMRDVTNQYPNKPPAVQLEIDL